MRAFQSCQGVWHYWWIFSIYSIDIIFITWRSALKQRQPHIALFDNCQAVGTSSQMVSDHSTWIFAYVTCWMFSLWSWILLAIWYLLFKLIIIQDMPFFTEKLRFMKMRCHRAYMKGKRRGYGYKRKAFDKLPLNMMYLQPNMMFLFDSWRWTVQDSFLYHVNTFTLFYRILH